MNVPRELVEAMLNQDSAKPYGLTQIATQLEQFYLKRSYKVEMAKRLRDFANQLEMLSQEEDRDIEEEHRINGGAA